MFRLTPARALLKGTPYRMPLGVSSKFTGGLSARINHAPVLCRPNLQFNRTLTSVQPVKKRSRWPLYLFFGTILGAYGYWKYITHHNFPPTVANLLREGLWATINGAGYRKPDYRQALMKYIEALQEADRLGMLPWSDEYTGIQVIIADMYERLGLSAEAAAMYVEIAGTYMVALRSHAVPENERDRLIQRDLRVVLLAGLLLSTDASRLQAVVQFVGPHLVLATQEAAQRSEELKFMLHEYPVFNVGYLTDIAERKLPNGLFSDCWGSYKGELFALREMMTGIAAAEGEYMQALMIKLKTTQIMLCSGFPVGECLLSAVNIASLMYLQAMSMKFSPQGMAQRADAQIQAAKEAQQKAQQKDAEASQKEIEVHLDLDKDVANKIGNELDAGADSEDDVDNKLLSQNNNDSELPMRKEANDQAFLQLSKNVYAEIIKTIKKLDQRRTEFIPEAYAMALYGQGVVAASQGNWALAAESMSEARLRARGSELQPLLAAVDGEIEKIEHLKDLTKEEIAQLHPDEVPSVDIMFWKLSPDLEDINRPELPDTRL